MKLKGNSLVIPDEQTLRRHFEKNKCYTGAKPPNCYEVERELIRSQNALRAAAVVDNELGKRDRLNYKSHRLQHIVERLHHDV